MARDIFDKVLTSVPVDRNAARVLQKGEHFESNKKITQQRWENPPKVLRHLPPEPSFTDLTGVRFGRFATIGFLGNKYWLVKCACGFYEKRRSRSITNPTNQNDRCQECRHLAFLRRCEARKVDPTTDKPVLEY